jgi:hypothetical protein
MIRNPDPTGFTPFGTLDGFVFNDSSTQMAKSLRLSPNGVGLLRLAQERAPGLADLPKLTASASRIGARPSGTKAVTFQVSAVEIAITIVDGGQISAVSFDELQNVRIDRAGRFFLMPSGESCAPLRLNSTPWLTPALAILMVLAARKGTLELGLFFAWLTSGLFDIACD